MALPHTVTSVAGSSRSVLPWIFGMVVVLAGSGIVIALILTRLPSSQSEQHSTVTQQSTPSPTPVTENKTTADKSAATSPVNANKSKSASIQTPVPGARALISGERPKNTGDRPKREVSKVTNDKKKAEQPKPTGESFIPVKS